MKKPPRDWKSAVLITLGLAAVFAIGATVGMKYVTPCICVHVEARQIN